MTKTAVIILNHNLPDYTDRLYRLLKPYERNDYDTIVLDNGSSEQGTSQFSSYKIDSNSYYGGGFATAVQIVLENEYDSLLIMNNDLVVHSPYFVSKLQHTMELGYDIVSPCFFNVEPDGQCHWKTMHNWGSHLPREVPFIDFQAPLISRRLLEKFVWEADLQYGWGVDVLFAHLCRKHNYKMAVVDAISMLHYNSMTLKTGVAGLSVQDYCRNAEEGQRRYFSKNNLMAEFDAIRQLGEAYQVNAVL